MEKVTAMKHMELSLSKVTIELEAKSSHLEVLLQENREVIIVHSLYRLLHDIPILSVISTNQSFLREKGSVLVWRLQSVSWKDGWREKKVEEWL